MFHLHEFFRECNPFLSFAPEPLEGLVDDVLAEQYAGRRLRRHGGHSPSY